MICLAEKKDALEIARIHKQEIESGFLSSLPASFLEKIYLSVIENDFCVADKEDNNIVGFIAGTADIKKLYSFFAKNYFFYSIFILLPKIFSISSLKKIFETLFYPKKENGLAKAELLTIAVKKEFQGKGIAGQMFEKFIPEMKDRSVKEFKVLVGEELKPAVRFYEKHGFVFLKKVIIHGGKTSRVYIYTIKNI